MVGKKTIGVLTSGGDAPGMNTALRAIVRTGIYYGNKIFGIRRGYQGLIEDDFIDLDLSSVSGIIKEGGTFIQTARCDYFYREEGRAKAFDNLKKHDVDTLIVIGGDGSFRGLHTLVNEHPVRGIGVPGTIDNDLYGTDYTIGFDTAVNTALQAIDKIRDTATSHSRLFIVEVMGRTSGHIALYAGIGGGAEEILIPETYSDIEKLCKKLEMGQKRGKKSSIIVVSEGDEVGDAFKLKEKIENYVDWEIKLSVLGHQQRGGSPTAFDRMLASRLGYGAVIAAMADENDKMVGIVNNELKLTPLEETYTVKKGINNEFVKMAEILAI
ncbi:MAG: 6-phosphofructokinase [Thermoplasmatota archaeon]|jgi:6-phosphofructokinase 1